MPNFFNQKVLAILKVKNRQFYFPNPAPEASPVLTLGITSKGQVRTRFQCAIFVLWAKLLPQNFCVTKCSVPLQIYGSTDLGQIDTYRNLALRPHIQFDNIIRSVIIPLYGHIFDHFLFVWSTCKWYVYVFSFSLF